MATIACDACQKPISFDESKLPPREVSFPCPHCKVRVTVDGRAFAPKPAEPVPAPAPAPSPAPLAAAETDDDLDAKALLAGVDDPVVREAARLLGFQTVHFPMVEACRDFYLQEYPPLVFLNPAQLSRPPLAEMQPLLTMHPADRRRGFFILLGDGLKTLDGTHAFLYSVDLVVAPKDLPRIQRVYREAEEAHQRLYASFRAAEKELAAAGR